MTLRIILTIIALAMFTASTVFGVYMIFLPNRIHALLVKVFNWIWEHKWSSMFFPSQQEYEQSLPIWSRRFVYPDWHKSNYLIIRIAGLCWLSLSLLATLLLILVLVEIITK